MDEHVTHGGPDIARLHQMLAEAKVPDKRWRSRAQEGVAFFYDRQWRDDDKRKLEARKQPVVTINRIKPTIRLIHGLVVSQPVDILAKPVGRNDDGIAEVATASLKYVNNLNDYKSLRELVYLDALLYGVGWGMAGLRIKNRDRRAEPVQNRRIDPREIRLDPQSQERDIQDARYIVWSRKVNLTDLVRAYPKYAEKLAGLVGRSDSNLGSTQADTWDGVPNTTPPVSEWKGITEGGGNWNQAGADGASGPKQVVVHELWERYSETVWLYERADGVPEEFAGPEDPEGQQVIYDPEVTAYYEDVVMRVRYSIFAGDCLLHEAPSPYKHDRLPFVPCWCDRDEMGDPVSMVESLKDPQREVNHRRSKALYDLNARPIRVTRETLNATGLDVDEVKAHAQDPNAIWIGEPGTIDYLNRDDRTGAQLDLYQDAKGEIQSVSGANDELMGYQSSTVSGKAKEIQISQGQTMMRPTEANLRAFDRMMAELNFQLIQQAHTEEWTVRVRDEMGRDKFLTVNERSIDPETGMERRLNSLEGARMEIELDVMPWTPTLRARNAEMIKDLAASEADPLLRTALVKLALQVSDMPNKGEVLDVFNQAAEQVQQMATAAMAPPPMPPDGGMPPEMMPPEAVA